jgi:hypothetical protein
MDANSVIIEFSPPKNSSKLTITGFKQINPSILAVDDSVEYLTQAQDNNYIATRIEALLALNTAIQPYMGALTINQAQRAQVDYTLDINMFLLDGTDVPALVLAQDGTTTWSKSALTSVLAPLGQVDGITKGRARLVAWDDTYVYWGATANKLACTPSPATRANQVTVPAASGKLMLCKEYENGFLIYTTDNIVKADYVGGDKIFSMVAFTNSKGITDPRHLAAKKNTHFAWTVDGLTSVDPGATKVTPLAPELTGFINKYRYPITLGLLSDRFLVIYLQDTATAFSNRELRNGRTEIIGYIPQPTIAGFGFSKLGPGLNLYPTYSRALVFDSQISKWGTADGDIRLLSTTTPYNQSAFQLSKDYALTSATLGDEVSNLLILGTDGHCCVANNDPADSYLCFGHYATHRYKDTKLVGVTTEFVDIPDAAVAIERSWAGRDIDWATNPADIPINVARQHDDMAIAGRWMNILIRGRYHLVRLLTHGYKYGRSL